MSVPAWKLRKRNASPRWTLNDESAPTPLVEDRTGPASVSGKHMRQRGRHARPSHAGTTAAATNLVRLVRPRRKHLAQARRRVARNSMPRSRLRPGVDLGCGKLEKEASHKHICEAVPILRSVYNSIYSRNSTPAAIGRFNLAAFGRARPGPRGGYSRDLWDCHSLRPIFSCISFVL